MASSLSVLSSVIETETSDVVTTSTEVWCWSKTSNIFRKNPYASSIRVEVTLTIVTPRLKAIDLMGLLEGRGSRTISVPSQEGLLCVVDVHRYFPLDGGQHGARVQHLRAEVGKLRRLRKRDHADASRFARRRAGPPS